MDCDDADFDCHCDDVDAVCCCGSDYDCVMNVARAFAPASADAASEHEEEVDEFPRGEEEETSDYAAPLVERQNQSGTIQPSVKPVEQDPSGYNVDRSTEAERYEEAQEVDDQTLVLQSFGEAGRFVMGEAEAEAIVAQMVHF